MNLLEFSRKCHRDGRIPGVPSRGEFLVDRVICGAVFSTCNFYRGRFSLFEGRVLVFRDYVAVYGYAGTGMRPYKLTYTDPYFVRVGDVLFDGADLYKNTGAHMARYLDSLLASDERMREGCTPTVGGSARCIIFQAIVYACLTITTVLRKRPEMANVIRIGRPDFRGEKSQLAVGKC